MAMRMDSVPPVVKAPHASPCLPLNKLTTIWTTSASICRTAGCMAGWRGLVNAHILLVKGREKKMRRR